MYRIFRENKQSLPGDEEIMKNQKPSIKIILQPLITDEPKLRLKKLKLSQLILQPNMIIESLKKYIKVRLGLSTSADNEVSLFYKNIEMLDHYTIKDIERIYSFTGEKTIFYYCKKASSQHNPISNSSQSMNNLQPCLENSSEGKANKNKDSNICQETNDNFENAENNKTFIEDNIGKIPNELVVKDEENELANYNNFLGNHDRLVINTEEKYFNGHEEQNDKCVNKIKESSIITSINNAVSDFEMKNEINNNKNNNVNNDHFDSINPDDNHDKNNKIGENADIPMNIDISS